MSIKNIFIETTNTYAMMSRNHKYLFIVLGNIKGSWNVKTFLTVTKGNRKHKIYNQLEIIQLIED